MTLTKTGFLLYSDCAKAHWVRLNRPSEIPPSAPDAFVQMLMRQGYEVEALARSLIETWPDADQFAFQVDFVADGLEARADAVRSNENGSIDLFEIKGSTSIKGSTGDHVVDAAFQAVVAERAGANVRRIHIVHVNKEYVREGPIRPEALLVFADVTDKVAEGRAAIETKIDDALAFLAGASLDEDGCECRFKGSPDKHCPTFARFNPDIAEPSLYVLPRITTPKLKKLDEEGRFSLDRIEEGEISKRQALVLRSIRHGIPIIDKNKIERFVGNLEHPLYFYDYETYGSAIPIANGYRPHEQIPVQFSVHRLDRNGEVTHFEFLADAPGMERSLVEALEECIGPVGHCLAWHMSTETGCNDRLARLVPEKRAFLDGVNARTRDLMKPFEEDYVDGRFGGSTSIKKVLPVLVPDLTYNASEVHDGTGALEAWKSLITSGDSDEKNEIRRQLLAYCKLDTLAMVEIYKVLSSIALGA